MASIAIKGARVFDGNTLWMEKTVVFENGIITDKREGDQVIDGRGYTLLPGLIDSHAHLYDNVEYLKMCAQNGVTTMLDMGNREFTFVDKLRNVPGAAGVFSVFNIGCAPGSVSWQRMGYPPSAQIKDEADAIRFVNEQVAMGADFLKLILEEPGRNDGVKFPPDVGKAFVGEAHRLGKLVAAHAVTVSSYEDGIELGVDELSHIPFSAVLPSAVVDKIVEKGIAVVPTVVMMDAIINKVMASHPLLMKAKGLTDKAKIKMGISADVCKQSVALLHKAGAKVFVGTDANLDDDLTPASVPYGTGMHDELKIFTECAMSPCEALSAATASPAEFFGLKDRGTIETGKRADLFLVQGDPTKNIADARKIKAVWVGGVRV